MTFYDNVRDFYHMWHTTPDKPTVLSGDVWARRVRLITEEFAELSKAHAFGDMMGFADGVADLTWVVLGTGVESGLPFNEIWNEVRRANMDKRGGVIDATGKILKPAGWKGPDIESIIREAQNDRITR